jgi:hypothetical protein
MSKREQDGLEFDEELARMLPRVEAPLGFTAKVMALAVVEAPISKGERSGAPRFVAKVLVFPKAPVWATGAIAAGLIVGAMAVGDVHVRHERQRAEAQRQFETATRITDRALERAREQMAKAGVSLEE